MSDISISESLKDFMREFPQGVTLVTTKFKGKPFGITISSFTSISLDPPLIMIAVAKDASCHEALVGTDSFIVHLLSSEQAPVAERFATKIRHEEKFNVADYADDGGNPILNQAPAYLECARFRVYDCGDHSIILGRVISAKLLNRTSPLIYHRKQFTTTALKPSRETDNTQIQAT